MQKRRGSDMEGAGRERWYCETMRPCGSCQTARGCAFKGTPRMGTLPSNRDAFAGTAVTGMSGLSGTATGQAVGAFGVHAVGVFGEGAGLQTRLKGVLGEILGLSSHVTLDRTWIVSRTTGDGGSVKIVGVVALRRNNADSRKNSEVARSSALFRSAWRSMRPTLRESRWAARAFFDGSGELSGEGAGRASACSGRPAKRSTSAPSAPSLGGASLTGFGGLVPIAAMSSGAMFST